jgi:hypothetical protein
MATCFPVASGVPGLSGAPQWWDSGGAPPRPYNSDLNDPRWRGAVRRGYQNGTGEAAVFRGLHMVEGGSPVLYASLQVFNDPTQGANLDSVYVGLQKGGGTAYVIEIYAYDTVADQDAVDVAGFQVYERTGSSWTSLTDPPDWLNQAKAWLKIVPGSPQKYSWAVNLRIPTRNGGAAIDDAGIDLGNLAGGATFKFWYAMVKDLGAGVVAYYWPRTGADITISGSGDNVYPDPATTWDTARTGSGAGCGTGISLNGWDIGTTNNDPNTGLPAPHLILVSTTAPAPTNHLYARPLNQTGAAITPNSLQATFRTANWGSAADFTFAAGATPWEEVLPGTTKDNGAASTPNGSQASIEFNWTIPTSDAGDWLPGGSKWEHQCMLVTLSGPYDFINDSAYRNMDFAPASVFQRLAEINLKGVKKLPGSGGKRDVYVYVDRSNMPRDLHEPEQPPRLKDVIDAVEERRASGQLMVSADHEGQRYSDYDLFDVLATYLPTIRYQVFHTTPGRINVHGKVKPVLEEQTSFGYFIDHEGDVFGWDQTLGGDFEKEKHAGLFKLKVPEGGKVVIRTKVQAWDERPPADRPPEIEAGPPQPPEPGKGGCIPWALGILAALIAFFRKLFK